MIVKITYNNGNYATLSNAVSIDMNDKEYIKVMSELTSCKDEDLFNKNEVRRVSIERRK